MERPTSRIPDSYPITHDPSRAPVPYGRWAPPLFTEWLGSDCVHEQQRTLFTLEEYLHDPEHVASCMQTGLIGVLCRLLHADDTTVRHKSAECLLRLSDHALGREQLIEDKALDQLGSRLKDSSELVRRTVHRVFSRLVQYPPGPSSIIQADFIPKMLYLLPKEHPEIQLLILRTLECLLKEDPLYSMTFDALDTVSAFLSTSGAGASGTRGGGGGGEYSEQLRAASLCCVQHLCAPLSGKRLALRAGLLSPLRRLLADGKSTVRGQAAATIASLLVTADGLHAAADQRQHKLLPALVRLAADQQHQRTRFQALQALAALAVHPRMRTQIRDNWLEVLQEATRSEHPDVSRCAGRALQQAMWEP